MTSAISIKKIIILVFLCLGCFMLSVQQSSAADGDCTFDVNGNNSQTIGGALDNCFNNDKSSLVNTSNLPGDTSLKIESGFRATIQSWIRTIGSILAILAVGSIVYGSLLLVISGGEEERLKKGKDVIKWGILGFLGVVFAGVLITIVINIMFSI